MVEVPVIPRPACREERVYGPEKISLGMFCAGLLEVTMLWSSGNIIRVVML
jgi:hypothetical protein